MAKRKRGYQDSEQQDGYTTKARIESILTTGQRSIAHALKAAKGFERQKMGRRLKTATDQKDEKAMTRINAEIATIKTLDLALHAEKHLYKRLLKIKSISLSPDLPDSVRTEKENTLSATSANIMARLYKSKPVDTALSRTIDSVQNLIAPVETSSKLPKGLKVKIRSRSGEDVLQGSSLDSDARYESDLDSTEDLAGHESAAEVGALEDFESDDLAEFDHRIASNSEEDASDVDPELENVPPRYNPTKQLSISPSLSPPREKRKKSTVKNVAATSSFLPTLSHVGYLSGSESEASDIDELVAPRKNRRGQRARQAIWEQKFGEKAKHLGKPKKERRDEGWDAKRGAVSQEDWKGRRHGKSFRSGPAKSLSESKPAPGTAHTNKKTGDRDDQGRLHPSWEAAKRAKEQKPTASFQGKKITFD